MREEVDGLRRQREALPAPHLDQVASVQQIEREAEKAVAEVEQRRDREPFSLDKPIEKAREIAVEVKGRTIAAARNVAERVEAFFGGGEQQGSATEKAPAPDEKREAFLNRCEQWKQQKEAEQIVFRTSGEERAFGGNIEVRSHWTCRVGALAGNSHSVNSSG